MNHEPKSRRGGARPGAGRKPVGNGNGIKKIIILTPALWEHAQQIGGGNASKGIRMALENHKHNPGKTMNEYQSFIAWAESQGFEFPCTSSQFHARAVAYAPEDAEVVERLCAQGIGPDWRDE